MGCGSCGGPDTQQKVDLDPITGKTILELTPLERLEYSHRMQARGILESLDPPEVKRQKLTELDDWLERTKQSPAFSV